MLPPLNHLFPWASELPPVAAEAAQTVLDAAETSLSEWDNGVSTRSEDITAALARLEQAAGELAGPVSDELVRRACTAAGVLVAATCRRGDHVELSSYDDEADDADLTDAAASFLEYLFGVFDAGEVEPLVSEAAWSAQLQRDLLSAAHSDDDPAPCLAIDVVVCAARLTALHVNPSGARRLPNQSPGISSTNRSSPPFSAVECGPRSNC